MGDFKLIYTFLTLYPFLNSRIHEKNAGFGKCNDKYGKPPVIIGQPLWGHYNIHSSRIPEP